MKDDDPITKAWTVLVAGFLIGLTIIVVATALMVRS